MWKEYTVLLLYYKYISKMVGLFCKPLIIWKSFFGYNYHFTGRNLFSNSSFELIEKNLSRREVLNIVITDGATLKSAKLIFLFVALFINFTRVPNADESINFSSLQLNPITLGFFSNASFHAFSTSRMTSISNSPSRSMTTTSANWFTETLSMANHLL